jgi:hypothetical protein
VLQQPEEYTLLTEDMSAREHMGLVVRVIIWIMADGTCGVLGFEDWD